MTQLKIRFLAIHLLILGIIGFAACVLTTLFWFKPGKDSFVMSDKFLIPAVIAGVVGVVGWGWISDNLATKCHQKFYGWVFGQQTRDIEPDAILQVVERMLKFPAPVICRHHVAAILLDVLKRHGFPLTNELAKAVVGADDETALKLLTAVK